MRAGTWWRSLSNGRRCRCGSGRADRYALGVLREDVGGLIECQRLEQARLRGSVAMELVIMLYLRSASHQPDVMRALAHIETINLDVLRIATDPHLFGNVTLQLLREVSDKAGDTNYAWPYLAYKLKDALSLAKMHDLHLPKKVCSLRQLNELEEFILALPGLRTA